MRRTRRLILLVAVLAALPAGAGTFKLHNAKAALRFEARVGEDGSVTRLTATPQPAGGGLPHVYFVDFAWTAATTHLVARNPSFGEALVRVTDAVWVPSRGGSGGMSVTTESYAVASGAVLHLVEDRYPSPKGQFSRNYAVIASDRPLMVSARAFTPRLAHELVPRELDCPGPGDLVDPAAPDAFFCEMARR